MGEKTVKPTEKKPKKKGTTLEELKAENEQLRQAVMGLQGALQKAKDMSFFMQEQFYDRMTRGAQGRWE